MRRIERIAVDANVRLIAAMFKARLQTIMARLTETADRTQQERAIIATMRREVIGDRRRRDLAAFFAKGAQGLLTQLMFRPSSPALQATPRSRRERLSGGEVAGGHG
jgi:hypothetical protein